jgi:hypothetical protein
MPSDPPVARPVEELLQQACAELQSRLRAGQDCPAEALLDAYPSLALHPGCVLDLILTEFAVRRELGQRPDPEDWLRRFPRWADGLRRRFDALGVLDVETTDGRTVPHTPPGRDTVREERRPVLGHYELLEEIGRGGMGVVYRARDTLLDRVVALKLIRSGVLAESDEIDRFQREARAAAHIQHPHIVAVHELGSHAGQHYLSMTLAPGGSLDRHRARFQPPREAAALVEKVARAVGAAHERGIVHRDLKPSNVLLDARDEPLVGDFGLAKFLQDKVELTQMGQRVGTPAYMAPEQAADEPGPVTPGTDVWALGVILYELLTGVRPFVGTSTGLASRIRTEEPAPPRRLCPGLDPALQAVVLHCLEKDPARRYPGGTDLADDLRRWLDGEATVVRPRRWPARVARRLRRHPVWCLVLLLLLAGSAVVPVAYWLLDPERVVRAQEAKLRRGEPLTLVGERGAPGRLRFVAEPGAVETPAQYENAFTVHSMGLCVLELAPRVPVPSYRLRGQVRHVDDAGVGHVGLYCLYNPWASPQGVEHFQCDLILDGRNPQFRDAQLSLRRYTDPSQAPRRMAAFVTPALPLLTPQPRADDPGPWYDLALVVTPQRVQAFLGDRPLQPLERRDFPDATARLFPGKQAPPGLPPQFPVGGGVGLFVYRGTACFRNVVLEPLPVEGPAGETAEAR